MVDFAVITPVLVFVNGIGLGYFVLSWILNNFFK